MAHRVLDAGEHGLERLFGLPLRERRFFGDPRHEIGFGHRRASSQGCGQILPLTALIQTMTAM
jgi:hypothetical protein